MKWVLDVLKQIQHNGFYEAQNLKQALEESEKRVAQEVLESKHNALLNAFDKKRVVYFGFIKTIGNKRLIKLGSTKDIKYTFTHRHPKDYETIKCIEAFHCEMHVQLEDELLSNKFITELKYKESVKKDNGCSNEVILVDDDEFKKVLKIIKGHLSNFPFNWDVIHKIAEIQEGIRDIKDHHQQIPEKKRKLECIEKQNTVVEEIVGCDENSNEVPVKKRKLERAQTKKEKTIDSDKNSNEDRSKMSSSVAKSKIPPKHQANCNRCNTLIWKGAKHCNHCAQILRPRKFVVSKEELHDLVWEQQMPYTKIGEKFCVSDNAIRKRCRRLGIPVRKYHKKN